MNIFGILLEVTKNGITALQQRSNKVQHCVDRTVLSTSKSRGLVIETVIVAISHTVPALSHQSMMASNWGQYQATLVSALVQTNAARAAVLSAPDDREALWKQDALKKIKAKAEYIRAHLNNLEQNRHAPLPAKAPRKKPERPTSGGRNNFVEWWKRKCFDDQGFCQ
ncbi:unnamed protein product [Sympodiomycopsis kandeliae]